MKFLVGINLETILIANFPNLSSIYYSLLMISSNQTVEKDVWTSWSNIPEQQLPLKQ